MSEEEKQEEPKQEEKPQPKQEEPQQQPQQLNQAIAQLLKTQEENKKTIEMLAKAIVEVNKKVEAKASGSSGGGGDALKFLTDLISPKTTTLEDFARQAEALAKASDAIDRFRNPARLGLGEAYLMRLGLRAAFPRYMTKAELKRAEKQLGVLEALEGEEGETEHVSE